ncbi:MAG: DedA family protein [Burkholderiales bacterium]
MEILYYLIEFFTNYGYFAVFFVLVACGFGLPIPEDITLIAGGVICALSSGNGSHLDPHVMVGVSLLGVVIGDGTMFLLGRKLGPKICRVPGLKHIITKNTYAKIQEKAHRYGDKILFIARFLPGLRAPIFVTAGISHKVPLWKFLLMDGSAALISVPIWVYLGYFFANDLDQVLHWVKQSEVLIISGVVILIVGFMGVKWLRKR